MSARAKPASRAQGVVDRGEHAIRFIEAFCRHTEGRRWAGQPIRLERWQREDIIRPLFGTLMRDGRRRYTEGLIGIPRKNGKSTLASAIAVYLLVADGEPGAEVYSAAGDKGQARIVFGKAREMIQADPYLRAWCRVYRDAIEVPETGSVYRVLSSDAPLKYGLNVHAAIIDELHVHRDPELYYALASASGARDEPLVLAITTAGADERTIAYDRYAYGRKHRDPRFFFRWWGAHDDDAASDRQAWRQANPARWLRLEYLASEHRRLPENVFRRLHLNQWVRQEERWLPMDLWDACDADPEIPDGSQIVVGVDAAPKRDTTAVVWARRDDAGFIHVRSRIFRRDEATGMVDYAEVEQQIRELASTHELLEVVYDPYHMTRSAQDLASEGLPLVDFPQTDARMVPASQALYEAVTERRLRHGGEPELREHAEAAAARPTSRGWRLHKMRATRPIDAVIALAIVVDRLERGETGSEPVALVV